MLIKTHDNGFIHPVSSEITPQRAYAGRREMMKLLAGGVAGAALAGWASREALAQTQRPGKLAALAGGKSGVAGAVVMEKVTDYKDASTYNNFYEFGTDKADPPKTPTRSKPRPGRWKSTAWSRSLPNTRLRTCSSSAPRKSASTACAAWKAGPW
jgi:sulfoxide reductase catalytic subunit YedY